MDVRLRLDSLEDDPALGHNGKRAHLRHGKGAEKLVFLCICLYNLDKAIPNKFIFRDAI